MLVLENRPLRTEAWTPKKRLLLGRRGLSSVSGDIRLHMRVHVITQLVSDRPCLSWAASTIGMASWTLERSPDR